jgi:hypothetical protein
MQESGRAGRDGTKSDCYLYFSYRDKSKLQAMIMKGRDDGGQANSHQSMQMGIENLLSCVSFCLNDVDCRRQQLLGYFGEHFTSEQCNKTCDNCANQGLINTVDFTEHAKNILLLVKEIDSNRRSVARLTLIKAAKLYSGAKDKETSKYSANIPAVDDIVKRAASISKISRPMVERLLMEMIIKKYLDEEVEENGMGFTSDYLKLGPNRFELERGGKQVTLRIRATPSKTSKAVSSSNADEMDAWDMDELAAAEQEAISKQSVKATKKSTITKATSARKKPVQPAGWEISDDDDDDFNGSKPAFKPKPSARDGYDSEDGEPSWLSNDRNQRQDKSTAGANAKKPSSNSSSTSDAGRRKASSPASSREVYEIPSTTKKQSGKSTAKVGKYNDISGSDYDVDNESDIEISYIPKSQMKRIDGDESDSAFVKKPSRGNAATVKAGGSGEKRIRNDDSAVAGNTKKSKSNSGGITQKASEKAKAISGWSEESDNDDFATDDEEKYGFSSKPGATSKKSAATAVRFIKETQDSGTKKRKGSNDMVTDDDNDDDCVVVDSNHVLSNRRADNDDTNDRIKVQLPAKLRNAFVKWLQEFRKRWPK